MLIWLAGLVLSSAIDEVNLLQTRNVWKSARDLAEVTPETPIQLTQTLQLVVQSVVPSFEDQKPVIAFIHLSDLALQKWLETNPLYCSGSGHRARMLVIAMERTLNLLCPWKQQEPGQYEVVLENRAGKAIGKVQGTYTPGLLGQYGTLACVRNIWNDRSANVSGLQSFPQWLEYHQMRGVQHFMVYTTSDMSPASAEVYQPYIDAGLVTRVHFNVPAEKCWFDLKPDAQQSILMNDCLYRSRGHTRWILPSLDVDEYLSGDFVHEDITRMLDRYSGATVSTIYLRKMRFARSLHSVEISSQRRSRYFEDQAKKYAAKVDRVWGVNIHWISPEANMGSELELPPALGLINHYRHPSLQELQSLQLAGDLDLSLASEVPRLESALERRLGPRWREKLSAWAEAKETTSWTCRGNHSSESHGPATWELGIAQ